MDCRAKVELYEQIRREYEFGAGTIAGVSRKLGVHRRMVRDAVRSSIPARRKKTERPHVKIEPAAAFIDTVLEADGKAPRKQRNTAKSIWERIRCEVPGCTAAERTVRHYDWVPVPVASNLAELNGKLLADCRLDEGRILAGRTESFGTLLLTEKEHLRPLPGEEFDLAEVSFPRVDQGGCAKVRTNFYSVPLKPGSVIEARVYSSVVEFWQDGVRIVQHERSYGRSQQILYLEHYLDVLEQKPGALRGSKPLAE